MTHPLVGKIVHVASSPAYRYLVDAEGYTSLTTGDFWFYDMFVPGPDHFARTGYVPVEDVQDEPVVEDWKSTPQEALFDHLYESATNKDGFVFDFYGVTEKREIPLLFVEDPDGTCWEITAVKHPHKP